MEPGCTSPKWPGTPHQGTRAVGLHRDALRKRPRRSDHSPSRAAQRLEEFRVVLELIQTGLGERQLGLAAGFLRIEP